MAKPQESGKSGKVAAAPRVTRDEGVDAAMRPAAEFASAQLKRPVAKWSDAAPDEQAERFNSRLATLRQSGVAPKLKALFAAKGKLAGRPKAGAAF